MFKLKLLPLRTQSGFSAVGSALRSGRRGRKFESCNPDKTKQSLPKKANSILFERCASRACSCKHRAKIKRDVSLTEAIHLYFVLSQPAEHVKITDQREVILLPACGSKSRSLSEARKSCFKPPLVTTLQHTCNRPVTSSIKSRSS